MIKYQPMETAPRNRTIIAKHIDRDEIRVEWSKRSGPPRNSYSGNREPGMVDGWCEREGVYVIPAHELKGWRECDEE